MEDSAAICRWRLQCRDRRKGYAREKSITRNVARLGVEASDQGVGRAKQFALTKWSAGIALTNLSRIIVFTGPLDKDQQFVPRCLKALGQNSGNLFH